MPKTKKSLKLAKKILFIFSLSFVFIQLNPEKVVIAHESINSHSKGPTQVMLLNHPDNEKQAKAKITATLPKNKERPYYTTHITATAYTSRVEETDDSPYIAAWGDHVFWGMVASNSLPKGTKIQIPEYFGDKMFVILDRMNSRYYHHIDIWMLNLKDAKKWGSRYVEIRVYK